MLLHFLHCLNQMPYKISTIIMKKNDSLSVYHVKYFIGIISFKPHSNPLL